MLPGARKAAISAGQPSGELGGLRPLACEYDQMCFVYSPRALVRCGIWEEVVEATGRSADYLNAGGIE